MRIPSRGSMKCLMAEKSVFTKRGPETGVREALPSSPAGASAKQAVLNHSLIDGLLSPGLQTWLGRIRLLPLFWKLTPEALPATTKMGKPEVAFSMPVISQFPSTALRAGFQELP